MKYYYLRTVTKLTILLFLVCCLVGCKSKDLWSYTLEEIEKEYDNAGSIDTYENITLYIIPKQNRFGEQCNVIFHFIDDKPLDEIRYMYDPSQTDPLVLLKNMIDELGNFDSYEDRSTDDMKRLTAIWNDGDTIIKHSNIAPDFQEEMLVVNISKVDEDR